MRRVPSTLDVDVPFQSGDDAFLALLEPHLNHLLDAFQPELVLYNAGVDCHGGDALGTLGLTDEGLWRRDITVLAACAERG